MYRKEGELWVGIGEGFGWEKGRAMLGGGGRVMVGKGEGFRLGKGAELRV